MNSSELQLSINALYFLNKVCKSLLGMDDITPWDFEFKTGDTIIMGRESAGVPEEVHSTVHARIKLPMFGQARSLNVAMSAAMAVSEACRQIRS